MSFGAIAPQSAQICLSDPAAAVTATVFRVPSSIGKITVTDWWAAAVDEPFTADGTDSITLTLVKVNSSGVISGTISAANLGGTAAIAAAEILEGAISGGTVDGGEAVAVKYAEAGTVAAVNLVVGIDYVIGIGE